MNEIDAAQIKKLSKSTILSIETFTKEIKLVAREKYEFENEFFSISLHEFLHFQTIGVPTQETSTMVFE